MTCQPTGRRSWHRRQRHRSFRPRMRLFESGEVRLALLSLLGERPQHGYDLMKELEERSGGFYRASAGTIYPTLQQLADEGLIDSEAQGAKRVHSLTDSGHQALEEAGDAVERIWRRTERLGDWGEAFDPEAAELVRPALRLLRTVARTARRSDDPELLDRVREILDRAREDVRGLRGES